MEAHTHIRTLFFYLSVRSFFYDFFHKRGHSISNDPPRTFLEACCWHGFVTHDGEEIYKKNVLAKRAEKSNKNASLSFFSGKVKCQSKNLTQYTVLRKSGVKATAREADTTFCTRDRKTTRFEM